VAVVGVHGRARHDVRTLKPVRADVVWIRLSRLGDRLLRPHDVGWQVSDSLRTDLCLDVLEQSDLDPLETRPRRTRASFRAGVQFLSIRYTERVADVGGVSSVGSRGDSFDDASRSR
jgi:hypothetical protein